MQLQNNTAAALSQDQTGRIYLELPGNAYKSRRCIGKIEGDTLHCFRDCQKHFFRKLRGYGFSYDLLNKAKYDVLALTITDGLDTEGTIYISRIKALQRLQILNFKKRGLERQGFLTLDEFYTSRDEALAWDNENSGKAVPAKRRDNSQLGFSFS